MEWKLGAGVIVAVDRDGSGVDDGQDMMGVWKWIEWA